MKKFIIALSLLLVFVFSMPFTACKSKWTEIQSITYTTQEGTTTLTSKYKWEYDKTEITEEDYNNAPEELKYPYISTSHNIPINRQNTLSELKNLVGKTVYGYNLPSANKYCKYTLKKLNIYYVKIIFDKDKNFKVSYYNENNILFTEQVVSNSYKITYFDN